MLRLILLTVLIVPVAAVALRRAWVLYAMVAAARPDPDRFRGIGTRLLWELRKVLGQKKLFQWTAPGLAHAFTFWGFLVIQVALLESLGEFFSPDFALPLIGHAAWLGFTFDFFIAAVAVALVAFAVIRIRKSPHKLERRSRFFGSHTAQAFVILTMIFGVISSLLAANALRHALGRLPYAPGAFLARPLGDWLAGNTSVPVLEALELAALVSHVGIVLGFLVLVLYSKHLHIFTSPLNVLFGRHPLALGRLRPEHIDAESMDENTVLGAGTLADLSWKHHLDMLTCTECGRCQSVCPAWATDKVLNPKFIVTDLRDHMFSATGSRALPEVAQMASEAGLVGEVISSEALWQCTTCGACVYECPVDIEHVDMIVDMRRHQVMMESAFPRESVGMLNNLESVSNPWGMGDDHRLDWAEGLDSIPVIQAGQPVPGDAEFLFWVGCAGSFDDRAKQTTRSVARLLDKAGAKFAVLGPAESCTGDPARRLGNEFLFQELAKANVAKLNAAKVRKIVVQCPHCFNTLANEYPDYGGDYEVVHHSQVLTGLVRDGRLKPSVPLDGEVTLHDPCYLARHNQITEEPRDVIAATGARSVEMQRSGKRTFCCGAGGARFWMEETQGKRVNHERIDEALSTGASVVATACPFCKVMLDDAVKDRQMEGQASGVEVVDIATLLDRSVNGAAGH